MAESLDRRSVPFGNSSPCLTMTPRARRHENPLLSLLSAALLAMLAVFIAGALWTFGGRGARFLSHDAASTAYAAVTVGASSEADLDRMGLDRAHGARKLSALGVQEYFMPQTTIQFDQMTPAVRACFGGQDRCTALVVPVRGPSGGPFAAHAAVLGGHLVFLLEDGTVAYKEMAGG